MVNTNVGWFFFFYYRLVGHRDFFLGDFSPLCTKFFFKEHFVTFFLFFENKNLPKRKMTKISPMFATTTFNMKGCLRFSHFHIFNVFNLAKYTYG